MILGVNQVYIDVYSSEYRYTWSTFRGPIRFKINDSGRNPGTHRCKPVVNGSYGVLEIVLKWMILGVNRVYIDVYSSEYQYTWSIFRGPIRFKTNDSGRKPGTHRCKLAVNGSLISQKKLCPPQKRFHFKFHGWPFYWLVRLVSALFGSQLSCLLCFAWCLFLCAISCEFPWDFQYFCESRVLGNAFAISDMCNASGLQNTLHTCNTDCTLAGTC